MTDKLTTEEMVRIINLVFDEWYASSGCYGEGPDIEANLGMKPSQAAIIARLRAWDKLRDSVMNEAAKCEIVNASSGYRAALASVLAEMDYLEREEKP